MMKLVPLLLVFALAGCGNDTKEHDSVPTAQCPDVAPCPEDIPGTLTVTVTDAQTGAAIDAPSFTLDGMIVQAHCSSLADADGGTCPSWDIELPAEAGEHTLVTFAAGYALQSTAFEEMVLLSGPIDGCDGCSPSFPPVAVAVALSPPGV